VPGLYQTKPNQTSVTGLGCSWACLGALLGPPLTPSAGGAVENKRSKRVFKINFMLVSLTSGRLSFGDVSSVCLLCLFLYYVLLFLCMFLIVFFVCSVLFAVEKRG